MLNIAHIDPSFNSREAEILYFGLPENGDSEEIHQTVFTLKKDAKKQKLKHQHISKIKNLNIIELNIINFVFLFLFSLRKFNLVHIYSSKFAFLGFFNKIIYRKPYILTNLYGKIHSFFEKQSSKIIISKFVELDESLKNSEKIETVKIPNNPFMNTSFHKTTIDLKKSFENKFLVGMVAPFEISKYGQCTILETARVVEKMESMAKYNIHFIVIGDGNDDLICEIEALNKKTENISFFAKVPNQSSYLNQLDMFIYPALDGEFNDILLDAIELNKPIIASDFSNINTLIKNNESGILIDPEDVDSLIQSIKNLIENIELREKLIFNAKKYIDSNHSSSGYIAKVKSIYSTLSDNK